MASRMFHQFVNNLVPGLTVLTGKVTIGASGAPTLNPQGGLNGVASIARTGAGLYTLTLQDFYVDYDAVHISQVVPSGAGITVNINTIDVTSTKTITFTTADVATGVTPTDPASGTALTFILFLVNSTVRV